MNTENIAAGSEDSEQDRVPLDFETQQELEALTVARIQYAPQEGGPTAVIRQSNPEASGYEFEVFFDGGFWGDGEETKYFDTVAEAMQAIGKELDAIIEEEGA